MYPLPQESGDFVLQLFFPVRDELDRPEYCHHIGFRKCIPYPMGGVVFRPFQRISNHVHGRIRLRAVVLRRFIIFLDKIGIIVSDAGIINRWLPESNCKNII